jgi:hypothetical protein
MNGTERLPKIETLSGSEKDGLILALWEELLDQRTQFRALEQRSARPDNQTSARDEPRRQLLAELQKSGTKKRRPTAASSNVGVRLGSGLGFLRSAVVIGALVFAGLAFAMDQGIGWYHSNRLEQKRLAGLQLQHAAFTALLVELRKVAYEPDQKSYRLTMAMRNLDPEHPIYVMMSPIRVFEQSGLMWREIPARAPNGQAPGVVKLTDQHTYETVFEPNLKDWTELMPGYMHIRFENSRLISRRSEPDDDIVERDDRYYVYLKPHGADDDAIRKRMKYPGKPPIYIPMPPH